MERMIISFPFEHEIGHPFIDLIKPFRISRSVNAAGRDDKSSFLLEIFRTSSASCQ
jgi:hypothetical protein